MAQGYVRASGAVYIPGRIVGFPSLVSCNAAWHSDSAPAALLVTESGLTSAGARFQYTLCIMQNSHG